MVRPGPGCAVWEITLRCNLNCMHCGSAAGKARSDELTTDEALQLCDDLKGIGCQGVAMMGGEPLLRKDWPSIAERVRKVGMDLSIITNGYKITETKFQRILDVNPELVTVSIDGGHAAVHDKIRGVPGAFKQVVSTLRRFVESGLPTGVITTVHKMNLGELPSIRKLLLGTGVAWQIQMATPYGRLTYDHVLSKEEYYSLALFIAATRKRYSKKELMIAGAHDMGYFSRVLPPLQVYPWQGCQAGISTLGIESNGNILGCLALPPEFVEGNIRERSLKEIWNDDAFSSYTRRVRRTDLGSECASCTYSKICKGGCSAVSHSMGGGLHRDPYCLRLIEEELKKNNS